MHLQAPMTERAVVHFPSLPGEDGGEAGVQLRWLEQGGAAAGRGTVVVQCDGGAHWLRAETPQPNELLVLAGELQVGSTLYGPGVYLKDWDGTAQLKAGSKGCTVFAKHRVWDAGAHAPVSVDTAQAPWYPGMVPGLSVMPLHEFETEHTALVRWAPGTRFNAHRHFGGEEILVLDGVFEDEHGRYPAGTWIRSPHMSQHQPFSVEGCTILVKTGHLLSGPGSGR